MSNPTERDIRREIADLRDSGSDAVPGATVEWGPAEPAERPDGMSWDVPSSEDAEGDGLPTLRSDLWGAQQDVLDQVKEGDADVVAFLAGYGTGKSVLGSADKSSRFAGAEFGGIWLDEPSHYGETLHDLLGMLTTRLRGVDGPKTQLWTLTGEGYNAAWEILEKRHDANGEPLGLDIEVVRGSVLDNPSLADGDKARFRRQYEGTTTEQQALHGGFAAATGLMYSNFSRETHVISHSEAVERVGDWRIYGYDAGYADPRVVLEVGKTSYDQLVVLDEFHESGSHVEDAIQWLDADHRPEGTIYCEHVPDEIEKMQRAGLRPEKAAKSVDAGISEVRKRLDPGTETCPSTRGGAAGAFLSATPSPPTTRRQPTTAPTRTI